MDPSQIKNLSSTLKARLMSYQHNKGKRKIGPLTLVIVALPTAIVTFEGDLSYMPSPHNTARGHTLHMALVIDTGVALPPMRSPQCPALKKLILINEKEAKEEEEEGTRALKKRRSGRLHLFLL